MKVKGETGRKVTRSYPGISVYAKSANKETDNPIFFPNMGMGQVEVLSESLGLDMSTAKADVKRYAMPESEFIRSATMG